MKSENHSDKVSTLPNIVISEIDLGMKQEIRFTISLSSGRIKMISILSCSVNLYSSLDKN